MDKAGLYNNDAFLAVDGNENGLIDSNELLGAMSPGPNGFATLLWYDGVTSLEHPDVGRRGADGKLDQHDALFAKLLLWVDRNHDGASGEEELESVAHAGITAIYTGYMGSSERDTIGNLFTFRGRSSPQNQRGVTVPRAVVAVRFMQKAR